jgi:hypothetical protein
VPTVSLEPVVLSRGEIVHQDPDVSLSSHNDMNERQQLTSNYPSIGFAMTTARNSRRLPLQGAFRLRPRHHRLRQVPLGQYSLLQRA